MTIHLEAPPTPSAGLIAAQLETVQCLWGIAGLPPTSGYATAVLAAAADDSTFSAALSAVDLDDADSVAEAVEALLRWRQRTFRATA